MKRSAVTKAWLERRRDLAEVMLEDICRGGHATVGQRIIVATRNEYEGRAEDDAAANQRTAARENGSERVYRRGAR